MQQEPETEVLVKQSSTQPVLAPENFWVSQNSSKNFTTKFQFVPKWTQPRQDTFCSAGDQVDSNTSRYDALDTRQTSIHESSGHEEQHSRPFHETP